MYAQQPRTIADDSTEIVRKFRWLCRKGLPDQGWQVHCGGCSSNAMKTAAARTSVNVVVATAVLVLVATAGCCLFDAYGDDHNAMSLDLCTALVFVAAPVLLVTLDVIGISADRRTWAATPASVSIPDPPPWR